MTYIFYSHCDGSRIKCFEDIKPTQITNRFYSYSLSNTFYLYVKDLMSTFLRELALQVKNHNFFSFSYAF